MVGAPGPSAATNEGSTAMMNARRVLVGLAAFAAAPWLLMGPGFARPYYGGGQGFPPGGGPGGPGNGFHPGDHHHQGDDDGQGDEGNHRGPKHIVNSQCVQNCQEVGRLCLQGARVDARMCGQTQCSTELDAANSACATDPESDA